jgi:molybdopterin-containing oxidoreductase family iron-sulfur binding subunit
MNAGRVATLVMLGGNPVYDAPTDFAFVTALEKVSTSVHLSIHENETSRRSSWHLPMAHPLEAWGDAHAADGSWGAVQPLIQPLWQGRTVAELLSQLADDEPRTAHAITRQTFLELSPQLTGLNVESPRFEDQWRRFLHDGFETDSAAPAVQRDVAATDALWRRLNTEMEVPAPGPDHLELRFAADSKLHDGRFANNAWLQELPDFMTKLTWDNAALMSPGLADERDLEHGDLVRLSFGGRELDLPVYVLPGHARHSVTVNLGYGRTSAGRVGDGVGFDTYQLRTSDSPWGGAGLTIEKLGRKYPLACTQDHYAIDTRGQQARNQRTGALVREGTLREYREHPDFTEHRGVHHPPLVSLWKEFESEGHRWGMAVDLNTCVGCNACVVACQAENNIPVVGKEEVSIGREMHWLRMDRYFRGEPDNPQVAQQPVACGHCELAPCEQVCPVAATLHSDEGLNVMVYNRCVGTRYCSNNCPYKVRRFNFFNYHKDLTEVEELAFNPEVSVRARGVMEKCTYCVQRIEHARITAKNEGRPVRDGDIVTACQQTCPTEAIVFGDLSDPESRVSRLQADGRAYELLAELNLKPRTSYMSRIRNPHPELDHGPTHGSAGHGTGHGAGHGDASSGHGDEADGHGEAPSGHDGSGH